MTAIGPPAERGPVIVVLAILLWLGFVGFVFWHDVSKHPVRAEDRAMVDRTVRLLAPDWRMTPDTLGTTTYPSVSRANGRTCVTLSPYRRHGAGGGAVCYASNGKVLEERIINGSF